MADIYQVQIRSGTAAQVDTFTGAAGELTYDTDTGQLRVHDGSTVGGLKMIQDNGGAIALSTVDVDGGTIDGTVIGGTSAAAGTFTNLTATGTISFFGATISNGGDVTTINIDGGTIDGTNIGGTTPDAGAFTNLTASGTVSFFGATISNGGDVTTINIDGGTIDGTNIGGTTPDAGAFTTLTATGTDAVATAFVRGTTNLIRFVPDSGWNTIESTNLAQSAFAPMRMGGSEVYLHTGGTNRVVLDSIGNLTLTGSATAFDTTPANAGLQSYYLTSSGIGYIGTYSGGGSTQLSFLTNSGGGAMTEAVRINNTGKMGIRTSSPNYSLTVANDTSGNAILQLVNQTTGTTASDGSYIGVLNGGSDMRVWNQEAASILFGTSGAIRLTIDSSGDATFEGSVQAKGGAPVDKISANTYTLVASDSGKIKQFANTGTTTVTIPASTLQDGAIVTLVQMSGTVLVANAAGTTLLNADSHTGLKGAGAVASIYQANTNSFILYGATA